MPKPTFRSSDFYHVWYTGRNNIISVLNALTIKSVRMQERPSSAVAKLGVRLVEFESNGEWVESWIDC